MALYFKGIRLRPSETENRACDVNSEQNFQPLHKKSSKHMKNLDSNLSRPSSTIIEEERHIIGCAV